MIPKLLALCLPAIFLACLPVHGEGQKNSREQGQFSIYVAGKEVGKEKFSIHTSDDSVTSSSTMNFRDPRTKQNAGKETELTMDSRLVPQSYKFKADIGGQTARMNAKFAQGEARIEYEAGGPVSTSGLLVGERYTVLDTNVFHHFVFIARLFGFESKEKVQSMEVVIPQEMRNGFLKVSDAGLETTDVKGKKRELHHLKADSGAAQIDLWVDSQHILHKLAFPSKGIEVVRE